METRKEILVKQETHSLNPEYKIKAKGPDFMDQFRKTLTIEEKQKESYLDFTDERLGELCEALSKTVYCMFHKLKDATCKTALSIAHTMHEQNVEELKVNLNWLGVTSDSEVHQTNLNFFSNTEDLNITKNKVSNVYEFSKQPETEKTIVFGQIFDQRQNLANLCRQIGEQIKTKSGNTEIQCTAMMAVLIQAGIEMNSAKTNMSFSELLKNDQVISDKTYHVGMQIKNSHYQSNKKLKS